MAERWKAWKSKGRISPLPTAPWKSRKEREIPTFPQLRRLGHGKVENQKQVSHFPTAIYSQVKQNGRLRRRRKGTFLSRLDNPKRAEAGSGKSTDGRRHPTSVTPEN